MTEVVQSLARVPVWLKAMCVPSGDHRILRCCSEGGICVVRVPSVVSDRNDIKLVELDVLVDPAPVLFGLCGFLFIV